MNQQTKKYKNLITIIGITLLGLLWIGIVAASWSEAAEPIPAGQQPVVRGNGDYDFSWLDPDKKIYVLQNRKYTKQGHMILSLMGTRSSGNAYRSTWGVNPRLGFYFGETLGLEAFFSYNKNSENDNFVALSKTSPNSFPIVREVRSEFGGLLHWAPFYAKINVFDSILYFDWYFTLGLGMMDTALDTRTKFTNPSNFVSKQIMGLYLGTGQFYHLSENILVRLDYTASFYKAPQLGLTGNSIVYSNSTFGIGLGVKF